MSRVPLALRLIAAAVVFALPLPSTAAVPTTRTVKQHVEDCTRNGALMLLDCQCVEKEATRLIGADKSAPWDVVYDRAAAACPSARAKAQIGDPRYRQFTFEERQAIRKVALDFVAILNAGDDNASFARLMATPRLIDAVSRMPFMRPQIEERVRGELARRAARGKWTDHRISMIGPDYVLVDARAETRTPGVEGDAAHAAQEVVKFEMSASGAPVLVDYSYGY